MIICDLCKRDPVATEKNEALKQVPWGIVLTPPPGSGLPEKRLCWECTLRVFERWVVSILVQHPELKPN
jgi:hypothetical protein